jgi:hypothetical protein
MHSSPSPEYRNKKVLETMYSEQQQHGIFSSNLNRWREYEVCMLLESYRRHCIGKKGKSLWLHVQQDLKGQGIDKTSYMIEKKWNNLLHRFNKPKSVERFPFYREVAEILGQRRRKEARTMEQLQTESTDSSDMSPSPGPLARSRSSSLSTTLSQPQDYSPVQLQPIHTLDVLIQEFHQEKRARQDSLSFSPFVAKLNEILRTSEG